MNLKSTQITISIFFLLLVLIILVFWFRFGNLFIGAEEGIVFYRIDYILEKMVSSVWLDLFLGTPYFSDLSKRPFYTFLSGLFSIGIAPYFLQIGTIFGILFGAALGSYYLFKLSFEKIPNSQFAALIGAIFYLSNPFVISQVWGRGLYPQFFAYLYFPVFLLLVVLYFKTKKYSFLLFDLVLAFILSSAMGNPTYFISLWVIVGMYWLYQNIFYAKSIQNRFKSWGIFVLFFLGWFLLNSWWLVVTFVYAPAAFLGTGSVFENSLESLRAVSNQNSFINIIRLYHGPHFESALYGNTHQNWLFVVISFIPVIFLLCSLYFWRKKIYIYYGILFLVSLFICLGVNPPFGFLFEYFFTHISLLQIFRNPYEKFGLVYLIVYSGLVGLGALAMKEIINKISQSKGNVVVVGLIVLISGIYCYPFWSGRVISWGTQVSIPPYYSKLDNWLKAHNYREDQVLFLPYLSGLGASYQWDGGSYHGNDPLYQIIKSPVITQTGLNDYLNALKRYKGNIDLTPALSAIGVRFIVERNDVISVTRDKKDIDFFTSNFYSTDQPSSGVLCDESTIILENLAWKCNVPQPLQNMEQVYFIDLTIRGKGEGYFDFYLTDSQGSRPRWAGKRIAEYQYSNSTDVDKNIRIYLNDPTENPDTQFDQIKEVSAQFFPEGDSQIKIVSVSTTQGKKQPVRGIAFKEKVGGMNVFEIVSPPVLPDIYSPAQVEYLTGYKELFESFIASGDDIQTKAFLLAGQNDQKGPVSSHKNSSAIRSVSKNNDKYLIEFLDPGQHYLVLNTNFNQSWQIVESESYKEGVLSDLQLLFQPPVADEKHYMVNGYANLWALDSESTSYIVLYRPQLVMNILWKLSVGSFLVVIFAFIYLFWRRGHI